MSEKKPDYMPPFSLAIPIEQEGLCAIDHLESNCKERYPLLSRQSLKQAMNKGAVWLQHKRQTQRIRRAKRVLSVGDTLYLYYNEAILHHKASQAALIYENAQYSLWNKPSGMPSQGSKWSDHCALTRWVEQQQQRTCFLIHRLDKAASGLIVVAHDKKTAAHLCRQFELRKTNKHYQAIVHGKITQDELLFDTNIDGKVAQTQAWVLDYHAQQQQTLLNVRIHTGRKHQIRRHLSEAGYPIVGDRLYGQEDDQQSPVDLQLRAWKLGFDCPIEQQPRSFTLPQHQRLSFST